MKQHNIKFYWTILINFGLVLGQNIELEQECNILNKLELLEAKIKVLELENQVKGTTYTRWGRTSCPGNGSELVYDGFAGGSHYSHTGAAVDYLCLPKDPEFAHFESQLQDVGGLLYGAEYHLNGRSNRMAFFPNTETDVHNNNVPCAVCKTKRSTVLMVPARQTCHDGWTLEYKGYLTSGHYTNAAASQFVCLDDEPEIVQGGSANENGKIFHFVEGRCGSLPCPPYVGGRELTCVICSK